MSVKQTRSSLKHIPTNHKLCYCTFHEAIRIIHDSYNTESRKHIKYCGKHNNFRGYHGEELVSTVAIPDVIELFRKKKWNPEGILVE